MKNFNDIGIITLYYNALRPNFFRNQIIQPLIIMEAFYFLLLFSNHPLIYFKFLKLTPACIAHDLHRHEGKEEGEIKMTELKFSGNVQAVNAVQSLYSLNYLYANKTLQLLKTQAVPVSCYCIIFVYSANRLINTTCIAITCFLLKLADQFADLNNFDFFVHYFITYIYLYDGMLVR